MNDPFLPHSDINITKALELIKNFQFVEPSYHTDDFGHIQVEMPHQDGLYSFKSLIELVDNEQQWPALLRLVSSNNEAWLLSFSAELQKHHCKGKLYCLFNLIEFFENADNKIAYLQNAAQWPWQLENTTLLDKVVKILMLIEQGLIANKDLNAEIDLSILRKTKIDIQLIKTKLKS